MRKNRERRTKVWMLGGSGGRMVVAGYANLIPVFLNGIAVWIKLFKKA